MSPSFLTAISEICKCFSLPQPSDVEDTISLALGDQVIHITEHPADSLLMFMFCQPEHISPEQQNHLWQQNMFSQDLMKPTLGKDGRTQEWVLWSRQDLVKVEASTLQKQVELLSQVIDSLDEEIPTINNIQSQSQASVSNQGFNLTSFIQV